MRTNVVKCLSQEIKEEIRYRFDNENVTKTELAKSYEVSVRTIGRVLEEVLGSVDIGQITEAEINAGNIEDPTATITNTSITLSHGEEIRVICKGTPNYKPVLKILIEGGLSTESILEAFELTDIKNYVEVFSDGDLTVDHEKGSIMYGTFEVKHILVDKIVEAMTEGGDAKPMVRFLNSLLENPKKTVVEELYPFMEHNKTAINPDGSIRAYKGIRVDNMDKYTGTIDNSVGQVVKMIRTEVDDDPNRTCSQGLHVGAYEYANNWGEKVVEVKIWPKNVVSVPSDYAGQKMRCCEYEVIKEV